MSSYGMRDSFASSRTVTASSPNSHTHRSSESPLRFCRLRRIHPARRSASTAIKRIARTRVNIRSDDHGVAPHQIASSSACTPSTRWKRLQIRSPSFASGVSVGVPLTTRSPANPRAPHSGHAI
ncbi:MAG: hypothetical protein ACK56F_05665, partial [bacterium]